MVNENWLEIINPDVRVDAIRQILFDFDGTISVIRQGWEKIMAPLMVEMICDQSPPIVEIVSEVEEYIDHSTGILTSEQMEWLVEAVRRYSRARQVRTAREYKQLYNERLLTLVNERLRRLTAGILRPDDLAIIGARRFVELAFRRGLTLYLASGTDHDYVVHEASALGVSQFFSGRIYGALDDTAAHTKARIISRILDDHALQGPELLVVGDGRVEMQCAKERGAVALGVASDEVAQFGWNVRKRERLVRAGADLLVPDFSHAEELADYLLPSQ
jgi:phosphoglycolate phosphatase-like HAD superfamily hydrolase